MIRKFINRKEELKFLEGRYKSSDFEFIAIYGRRRVGKTELIKEFMNEKKSIYFLADKRGTVSNVERFSKIVGEKFDISKYSIESFDDVFKQLSSEMKGKRVVIVIDEFPYLIEKDDSIPSVFQLITDNILKSTKVFLILCSSSVSMMEKGVLSYKSPLYGRRTGQIKLKPFGFQHLKGFFPDYNIKERVIAYSILGGIPAYLKQFDSGKSILRNIQDTFFVKEHLFYNEPEIVLKEELREPRVYFNILSSMSEGNTKLTDIANRSGMNAKDVPVYINTLINLGFVKKESLVTEHNPKTKKSLYFINDNFFRFWFRFIFPERSQIEGGYTNSVLKSIKENFNQYLGRSFEDVCRGFLLEKMKRNELPLPFQRMGKWWGYYRKNGGRKSEEIDIVALNEKTKDIAFIECKWNDKVNINRVLGELKKKAGLVDWNKNNRKEHYIIFAKGFKEKKEEPGLLLFDLDDLEKVF